MKMVLPQPAGLPVRDLNVVLLCDSTVKKMYMSISRQNSERLGGGGVQVGNCLLYGEGQECLCTGSIVLHRLSPT